jgi:hypothetical protein
MFDGFQITFKHVIQSYNRDLARIRAGGISHLPRFNDDVVFKNSWNCMSVANNKVLVHGPLTADMRAHMRQTQDFQCSKSVEYLNKSEALFRDIFLNKGRRIFSMEDLAFNVIDDALDWFSAWKRNVDSAAARLNLTASDKNTLFLAWQTFDLLRVLLYGFKEYCRFFFEKYGHVRPRPFISPIRMTGSALELIFCILKQMKGAAGMMNEAKMEDALATLVMQKVTGDTRHSRYHDRDYVAEDALAAANLKRARKTR